MPKNLVIVITLLFSLPAAAQKGYMGIGIKLVNDLTLYDGFAPGFGGQFTYIKGIHGGLETGVYFTTWDHHYISTDGTVVTTGKIAERHLYLPLLYRYESKKLNFTAGVAVDFFLHFREKTKNLMAIIPEPPKPGTALFGTAGISRSIFLSSTVCLEPEIRVNYKFMKDDGSLGLNLALRKLLL